MVCSSSSRNKNSLGTTHAPKSSYIQQLVTKYACLPFWHEAGSAQMTVAAGTKGEESSQ